MSAFSTSFETINGKQQEMIEQELQWKCQHVHQQKINAWCP